MVEREKIKLILTRIPGIENSRYALQQMFVEEKMTGQLSEIMIGNIGGISWE